MTPRTHEKITKKKKLYANGLVDMCMDASIEEVDNISFPATGGPQVAWINRALYASKEKKIKLIKK